MSDGAKEWLTRKEASLYLNARGCPFTATTLANMARHNNQGGGPPLFVSGWKTVRYKRSDLDEWLRLKVRRVA